MIYCYTRVSTDGQAEHGMGRAVQEQACRDWIAEHESGEQFGGVFHDTISGTVPPEGRDGWLKLTRRAREGDTIVVARLDRLARQYAWQEMTLQNLHGLGVTLMSVAEPEWGTDAESDPTRKMVRQILGAIAEHERAVIRARMDAGKARKRAEGGFVGGGVPYGWHAAGGELIPNPTERRVLGEMRRLHEDGWSARAIARHLNDRQVQSKHGKTWHARTVLAALNDPRNVDIEPPGLAIG